MAAIASDSIVQRRDHTLSTDLSETETVMLDIERGMYFGLQDVGKVIWEQLEQPTTLDALCDRLVDRFEVEPDTCRSEVTAFLAQLHEQGLIDVHGPDTAA